MLQELARCCYNCSWSNGMFSINCFKLKSPPAFWLLLFPFFSAVYPRKTWHNNLIVRFSCPLFLHNCSFQLTNATKKHKNSNKLQSNSVFSNYKQNTVGCYYMNNQRHRETQKTKSSFLGWWCALLQFLQLKLCS